MNEGTSTVERRESGDLVAGRYRVLGHLGEGGMGVVYRVEDTSTGDVVALKSLSRTGAFSERALQLFKTEFWAMTRLRHTNLPEVFDFGLQSDGSPYFTMELIGGADLSDCLPLALPRFYDVFVQLSRALAFIHNRGLIHRDVKASNVRIVPTPGGGNRVVLMDFGLVSAQGKRDNQPVSGTPAYLAPEALTGPVLDARADLYSLGILAAQSLLGRLPRRFSQGAAPAAMLASGTHVDLSPLSDSPPRLVQLIRSLVADNPARRPLSARQVCESLADISGTVLPSDTMRRGRDIGTSTLVGRDREMARLRAALDAAREGRGGVVIVSAAAGAGKSRLLHEFRVDSQLGGAVFTMSECRERGAQPLQPVLEALVPLTPVAARDAGSSLRRYAPVLLPFLPGLARHVPGVKPAPELPDPAAAQERLLAAVVGLLKDLAAVQPLILGLDDLQWSDGTTLRLLDQLLETGGSNGRLLVVAGLRSDETKGNPALEALLAEHGRAVVPLEPFDTAMIRDLLTEQFAVDDVPAVLVTELYRKTGGNAYFLQELLRYLVAEDLVSFADGRWHLPPSLANVPLPDSLSAILERLLEERSPEERALIELFAVAERPLDDTLLTRLAEGPPDALARRLQTLQVHQLIEVDADGVSVRHERILQLAYSRASEERRAALHLAVARALDEARAEDPERYNFPDGEIGLQYRRGGDGRRAVDLLFAAGRQAFRIQALEEAVRVLVPAEEMLNQIGETEVGGRMDVVQALLMRAVYSGAPSSALPIASRYLERVRSLRWFAAIPGLQRRFGRLGVFAGLLGTAVALKRRNPGFSRDELRQFLRRYLTAVTWRAQGLAWAGRYAESHACAEELAPFAVLGGAGRAAKLIAATGSLLFAGRFREQEERLLAAYEILRGRDGEAFPSYDRKIAIRGAIGGALAQAAALRSDPEALGRMEIEDGVDEVVEVRVLEGVEAMVRASFHAVRGESRALRSEYARYLDGSAVIRPEEREEIEHWVAWAAQDRGDFGEASKLAESFRHRGAGSEAWREIVRAREPTASALARISAAERAVQASRREGGENPFLEALGCSVLVEAQLASSMPSAAGDAVARLLAIARDPDTLNPFLEVLGLRASASVALAERDATSAAALGQQALEVATRLKNPIQRGFCLRTLGHAEALAGRNAQAQQFFEQARVQFEQLDNGYQRRQDRASETSVFTALHSHTSIHTSVLPALAEGFDLRSALDLVSSLDVDEVAGGMLGVLRDAWPDHRCVLYLSPAEARPGRILTLDGSGEVFDDQDAVPLPVLAALTTPASLGKKLSMAPGGLGWLLPVWPAEDDDLPTSVRGSGEEPIGILYVPAEPEQIPELELLELEPLLQIASAALFNAVRYELMMLREYRLTILNELGRLLGVVRSQEDLLHLILDRMIDLGSAQRALVMLRDEKTGDMRFEAGRDLQRKTLGLDQFETNDDAIDRSLRSGEIVQVQDDQHLTTRRSVLGLSFKHVTVVPMRSMVRGFGDTAEMLAQQQKTLLAVDPGMLSDYLTSTSNHLAECIGVVYLESRITAAGTRQDLALLRLLADQAGFALDISRLQRQLVQEAAEQERLKQHQKQLARYLSADVADAVMANPALMRLGGDRREITVVFTDVRGFTHWSSARPPELVVGVLNRILTVQTEVVFEYGGTLDKFLGDGLMALFGAPIGSEDHAARAAAAAVEMQRRLSRLLRELAEEGLELEGIGIGVHTGDAAVGNVGSDDRMEYTAIGDTVNLASRLCGLARSGQVLLSRSSALAAGLTAQRIRHLDPVRVKGIDEPVDVVEAVVS